MIKKYHPDINKSDKTAIKLINKVKKGLETNSLKNNNHVDINDKCKDYNDVYDFSSYQYIVSLISKLTEELKEINKKLKNVIQNEIKKLKRITVFDKLNIFLMILFAILTYMLPYSFVIVLAILYGEILYIFIRFSILKKKSQEINNITLVDIEYSKKINDIKYSIDKLNKDMFNIKREKSSKI